MSFSNLRLWESKPKRGFDLQSFNGTLPFNSLHILHCSIRAAPRLTHPLIIFVWTVSNH